MDLHTQSLRKEIRVNMQHNLISLQLVAIVGVWAAAVSGRATAADENWKPLFNGKDLSGWAIVNVAPTTFSVRDEMIVSTGKPTGTLRTERMYENFVMPPDWQSPFASDSRPM